jgi:hypothetical protein
MKPYCLEPIKTATPAFDDLAREAEATNAA